jgi:hypothetical protein
MRGLGSRARPARTTWTRSASRFSAARKGASRCVLRRLGEMPPDARPAVGKRANEVKTAVAALLEAREAELATGDSGRPGHWTSRARAPSLAWCAASRSPR